MPSSVYILNLSNQNEEVPVDVTDVIVEEGITVIKANTFYRRRQLRSIVFPQSLKEIEEQALADCPCLYSIFIPRKVSIIGRCAFGYCKALCEVMFENGSKLKSISRGAFMYCKSLKSIVIPKAVNALGDGVFNSCENLKSITFEQGSQLETIPSYCFYNCHKLRALIIPDAIITIQESAFSYCYNLTSIYFTLQSKLQHIGAVFFRCPNLQFINVPSTIISIHNAAFDQCDALSSTSTLLVQHQQLQRIQHGYDNLPLHQLCFRNIHAMTQEKLDSIPSNDPSLIEQDQCGLTPLHIMCSNPHTNTTIIKQIYNKCPDAATVLNDNNMTPWQMYLVMKGVIVYRECCAISNGVDQYDWFDEDGIEEEATVSDISKDLLRQDEVLDDIHNLITMGLDYGNADVYNVTLGLNGISFQQECNRSSETNKFYPFMAMAASSESKLWHVYDMAIKTCVHNIQRKQRQTLGKRKSEP